jgi:[acyl-carrier-protein] S-malonyltransferase
MSDKVGFIFPGQGSQSVGMGQALVEGRPDLRQLYDDASKILGFDLAALCFDGPGEQLNKTEFTQPALLVTSVVALRALGSNLTPVAVAGHSLGEYSAIVAAGGLEFQDAVQLVHKRATFMAEAVSPGSGLVAAVLGLTPEAVKEACQEAQSVGVVSAANFNAPGQVVIAGEKEAVERAIEIAKAKGCRRAMPLPVSVPVHTALMKPAADRLASFVESAALSDLRVPLINNADAKPLTSASEIRESLIRQLPSSVLWEQSIRVMGEMGVTIFVEIGPGTVLTGLVKRILPEATLCNVHNPESLETTLSILKNVA